MLFTIPTRRRPASLSIQYQPRSSIGQNENATHQNESVTMRSINTHLSEVNSIQTTRRTMKLLFQARKPKSVSSSKKRVANILVEEYKKPTPQQVVFPFFPTKNNNMTLENMPVLNAGKEISLFQENIPIESDPKPEKSFVPSWERNDKEVVFTTRQAAVNIPENNPVINVVNEHIKDIVVNETPIPVAPWKPSWER